MRLRSLPFPLLLLASVTVAEERVVFAAGCFWSVELAFQRVPGVIRTSVGYSGGEFESPSYHDVTTGRTGHAEAVEVVFSPDEVAFAELLQLFWNIHDPTTKDRQGGDVGTQYRSAIFYTSDAQLTTIESSKPPSIASRITTEIKPLVKYWPAEEYHQQYLEKGGQDATKGSLQPIQCYGNRGPIKKMDKPAIKQVLKRNGVNF